MSSKSEILFTELFDLNEIQKLQDVFSETHQVASIITHPDGTPITKPSNFTDFCFNIVRSTKKGCENCYKSDSVIGKQSLGGPIIQPCNSAGLWDAGVSISVSGKHIASWLIGQIRNEDLNDEKIYEYADEIGVEKEAFKKAYEKVPYMSLAQFHKVSNMLYYFANQISDTAYAKYELEKSIAEKDKFFSIIAHDLKSPFNSFLGYTELMVDKFDNMSLNEIQTMAIEMKKTSRNLYNLLENLLQWSFIKRGNSGFEPSIFSVNDQLKGIFELLRESIKHKEIHITTTFPENFLVFADRNMFGSVLRNLLTNAIKFSFKGNEIKVGAHVNRENMFEITVQDFGVGMSPEISSSLFTIDSQTCRQGTEGEKSTGLGLIICKEFVEKHGGELWVESTEGKGSKFHFTIPRH